jgi:hypothetical protein
MSKWFWIITLQQIHPSGNGWSTATFNSECDLPAGVSRKAVFEEIRKATMKSAGWEGGAFVLFFSLEPATLPAVAPEPAPAIGGAS